MSGCSGFIAIWRKYLEDFARQTRAYELALQTNDSFSWSYRRSSNSVFGYPMLFVSNLADSSLRLLGGA